MVYPDSQGRSFPRGNLLVFFLLYFLATLAVWFVGYASGVAGLGSLFVTIMLPILIAAVIHVIINIVRPRRGLIKVGQQRLIELRQTLAEP